VWLAASVAGAEEPPPVVLRFDSILAATVQASRPDDEVLAARAAQVSSALEAALGAHNLLIPMSAVPSFDEQGYDATTYMVACPPGQYPGCALVVGRRAGAQWVAGGLLSRENGREWLSVTFIEVAESREVLAFDVIFDGTNDKTVLDGLAAVFDRILQGGFSQDDVRDLTDPGVLAEVSARREALVADAIRELAAYGAVQRTAQSLKPDRLSRAAVAEMDSAGDRPWVPLSLSPESWRRYTNSGLDLSTWKRRGRGCQGSLWFDGDVGGGQFPVSHRYEGKALLDDQTLQPVEMAALQETTSGSSLTARAALGFGVLPFLAVRGAVRVTSGVFDVVLDEDVVGQPVLPGSETDQPITTTAWGGGAVFVPFPRAPVRPRLEADLFAWRGRSLVPDGIGFPQFPAPWTVALDAGAGVEARLTDLLALHALMQGSFGVVGDVSEDAHTGAGQIDPALLPVLDGGARVGLGGVAGVTVRIPVLGSP
jgi:hypothetical protein